MENLTAFQLANPSDLFGLRGDSHPNHTRQRNSLYLSIFTHHHYLTILDRDATHAAHIAIDERALVGFD